MPEPHSSDDCPIHLQPVKWKCGVCGQPLCPQCKPIGFNYLVCHPACIEKARTQLLNQKKSTQEIDSPTTGVKVSGWYLMVKGMIFFGLALFLFGVAWFSQNFSLRALLANPLPFGVDAIPGGREMIVWAALICLALAVLWLWLGMGLLNCLSLARKLVLLLSGITILIDISLWLLILISRQGFWKIPVIATWLMIFLLQPKVKKQFQ